VILRQYGRDELDGASHAEMTEPSILEVSREKRKMPPNYVWPLSNTTTPDEMNTSFGARIDEDCWDFHDGIDLPASIGTVIHAMRGGKVHHAGPGGSGGFSSRHVVVSVDDPVDGLVYNVYLHLASIDAAIVTGNNVTQGQLIGTVGDDDATYPHLHMEFRKGTVKQIGSVHPLSYLPYADTPNLSAPVSDRFNRLDAFMAARLLFGAHSKLEGDLKRVEVDLRHGTRVLATRVVDFDDCLPDVIAHYTLSVFIDNAPTPIKTETGTLNLSKAETTPITFTI